MRVINPRYLDLRGNNVQALCYWLTGLQDAQGYEAPAWSIAKCVAGVVSCKYHALRDLIGMLDKLNCRVSKPTGQRSYGTCQWHQDQSISPKSQSEMASTSACFSMLYRVCGTGYFKFFLSCRNAIGKDPSGVHALCEVLRHGKRQGLQLHSKQCRVCPCRSNLTIGHVDLRNNRVNNVGAKYIGEMLAANTTAAYMQLNECVCVMSCSCICHHVSVTRACRCQMYFETEITHLDLSWNDLGADGGLALLEGHQL